MEPTSKENQFETSQDLKNPIITPEDEEKEARTPTPREKEQADRLATLEAELFAEPSNADGTKLEQATKEGQQLKKDEGAENKEAPPEKVEGEGKKSDEVKAEEVAEAVEFAKLFPGGLEVPLSDGKKIVVTSEQDLIDRLEASERKEAQDLLNWKKSLMDRGQKTNEDRKKLNEEQTKFLAERKASEQELVELRKLKADVERARNMPARPIKPDETLNDPESDRYNPVLYRQQREAYDAGILGYVDKRVEIAVQRAKAGEVVDPIEVAKGVAFDAAQQWFQKQTDLTAELVENLEVRAEPKFTALLAEIEAHNVAHPEDLEVIRPRDVAAIYSEAKTEILAEAKAKDNTVTASERATKTVLRSLARAKDGPKPSKTAEGPQSEIDPFDETMSVEDYQKQLKSGKLYDTSR